MRGIVFPSNHPAPTRLNVTKEGTVVFSIEIPSNASVSHGNWLGIEMSPDEAEQYGRAFLDAAQKAKERER